MSTDLISRSSAALVAVLVAAGLSADRYRRRPVRESVAQQVVVRPGSGRAADESDMPTGFPVSWGCIFICECYAKAAPGQPVDEAVGPLVSAVYSAVMADPTLGGQVDFVTPLGYDFEDDAEADALVCVTLTFNIRQRTVGTTF